MWAESVVIQSIFFVFKSTVLPLGFLVRFKGNYKFYTWGGVRGVIFYGKKIYTETVQAVTEHKNSIFLGNGIMHCFTKVESTKPSAVLLQGKPQDIRIFKEVLSILIRW